MCVHRTDNGQCKKYSDNTFTSYCVDGPCPDDTPTNADRIRGMSDEELAEFLSNIRDCGDYDELKLIGGVLMDYVSVIDWLRAPAETEGTE